MTPDSDSERIIRLEAQMTIVERDLRAVYPLVRENGELKTEIKNVRDGLGKLETGVSAAIVEFRKGLDDLKEDTDRAEKERETIRAAREDEERREKERAAKDRAERALTERRDRWARWVPTVAVVVAIIVGIVDQI
jgi:hypothetical protein